MAGELTKYEQRRQRIANTQDENRVKVLDKLGEILKTKFGPRLICQTDNDGAYTGTYIFDEEVVVRLTQKRWGDTSMYGFRAGDKYRWLSANPGNFPYDALAEQIEEVARQKAHEEKTLRDAASYRTRTRMLLQEAGLLKSEPYDSVEIPGGSFAFTDAGHCRITVFEDDPQKTVELVKMLKGRKE